MQCPPTSCFQAFIAESVAQVKQAAHCVQAIHDRIVQQSLHHLQGSGACLLCRGQAIFSVPGQAGHQLWRQVIEMRLAFSWTLSTIVGGHEFVVQRVDAYKLDPATDPHLLLNQTMRSRVVGVVKLNVTVPA